METTTQQPPIYIPAYANTLENAQEAQIRLGIQGYMGTSKTWAALTFPNPIVANVDRGLGAHLGRKDVVELPMYSTDFCKKISKTYRDNTHFKEMFLTWLQTDAQKIESNQTLVVDGLTSLEIFYHIWYKANPIYSAKTGKEDQFAEWRTKVEYFGEIFAEFKKLKCHVVMCCHESAQKDKGTGEYTGKIRPLITGQVQDKVGGDFTDWVRAHSADKPKDFNAVKEETLKNFGMTKEEFKAMCDTFPRNTIYFWQLESDDVFDGKVSSLVNFPRYIPANYQSFMKYSKHKKIS